jgi:hypothetical protein
MAAITLFDLMGVRDEPSPRDAALARWPVGVVQAGVGRQDPPDTDAIGQLLEELDASLEFRAIRPGADAGRVGVVAELHVGAPLPVQPIVLTRMPDVEFRLLATGTAPPRAFVTSGTEGTAMVIDALPVEIRLPRRMLMPLEPRPGEPIPLEDKQVEGFQAGFHDTLGITLRRDEPTSIYVHVKVRFTGAREVVIEPAVPLSIGPCRIFGLPCRGVHDLALVPFATLAGDTHATGQALEWIRHPLAPLIEDEPTGFVTFRTIDFDDRREPFSRLIKAPNEFRAEGQKVEIVLEDLAMPMNSLTFPVPTHFTFGMRRKLGLLDDPSGAYDLSGLPVKIHIPDPVDVIGGWLVIEQLLLRSVRLDDPNAADAQFLFAKMVISDDPTGAGHAATIDVTDEWTLELGWRHDPGIQLFKLFGLNVRLLGARVGFSFQRATNETEDYGVEDLLVAVADLELLVDKGDDTIGIKPDLDKPKVIVVRDFGWRLGSFSIGKFWDPDGADLVAFDVIRLHLDEYGFVSDPNGGRYFALSATLPLGTEAVTPKPGTPSSPDKGQFKHAGGGLTVHRLRTKIAGDETAPQTLLDGITLGFREGPVQITGSGMIGDYVADGVRFREFGIGAQVRIDRSAGNQGGADGSGGTGAFAVGASFFYGRATGQATDFRYLLASASVSPIPIGCVTLADVRALFAWNLAPTLGELDAGAAQPMRLFEWYRANDAALTLPPTRNMSTGGWTPLDESLAVAVGAGVQIGGAKFVTIKAFLMYRRTPAGMGFLAAVEIYPFKAKKPVAYGAFEIDGDRWSLLIGLSVGTKNLIGKDVPLFKDAPFLTGTFYMTNKPGTVAVGHVNDPSSWLSLHIGGKVWVFELELYAGLCLELIDLPEGPRVIAMRVSVNGGTRLLKVGGIDFYLTLEAIVGTWRNESNVSGFVVWFEGGINIDVFWVFDFGASVKVQWDYLGPDPAYRRVGCELRIHTPWWLPDVTFRWNKTFGAPQLERMHVVSTPLIAASARPLARTDALPLAVSPIVGNAIDEPATYSTDELAQVTGAWPPGALDAIEPIPTDASLALSLKPTVDDRIAWGQNTPAGMGTQGSRDVAARYMLVELGIRRKPRFAGNGWSALLDPQASRLDPSLLELPPEQLPPRFASAVRLRWDADFQREQKLDARQLLVNAETPYFWILADLEADENLLRTVPGWLCCGAELKPLWHTLDFGDVALGVRAATPQRFTDSNTTLHWIAGRPPLAAAGTLVNSEIHVVRIEPARRDTAPFARINFDAPAHELRIDIRWQPLHLERQLVVLPFRGLHPLPEHSFELSHEQTTGIAIVAATGMTHVLLRLTGESVAADNLGWLELIEMRYRTLEEVLDDLVVRSRCDSPADAKPGGARFAWLANHDYEIRIVTRVAVKDERAGEIAREIPQHVFFRTKGLPGLNAVERIGEEIDPYLESVYPAPAVPLYRDEGIWLAFNERFDMFQGIDRPVQPGDPAERQQTLDFLLCVERVGGRGGIERLSVPAVDWIVAHRGTVSPPDVRPPKVIDADVLHPILHRQVRGATSLDPQMVRFEAVLASPTGCGIAGPSARQSRVLAHDPVDLDAPADSQSWAARGRYRAALRLRNSPFINRVRFEDGDDTGFLWMGAGSSRVVDGALEVVATSGAIRYGSFGETTWDHFTVRVRLRIETGVAGIALGLQGPATTASACLVRLDLAASTLAFVERVAGAERVLLERPIDVPEDGVWSLQVDSYDDAWRVQLGPVEERVPKSAVRGGRIALFGSGTMRVESLTVDGVDAFRFEFEASRWRNFGAHVASFEGRVKALPELAAASRTPEQLAAAIAGAAGAADRLDAQRRFDDWIAGLSIGLTVRVERLEIGARTTPQGMTLLLIESPEPFAVGDEIRLTIWRQESGTETELAHLALLDGARCRALIVPVTSPAATATVLPSGRYRLQFELSRMRYRASGVNPDSVLSAEASVHIDL